MKRYADIRRHAAECSLRAGYIVLMKKYKSFKGGTLWHREPAIVLERHNAVIVQRVDGYMTMRHCGKFRRVAPGSRMSWKDDDTPVIKETGEKQETAQETNLGHSAAEGTMPLPHMDHGHGGGTSRPERPIQTGREATILTALQLVIDN